MKPLACLLVCMFVPCLPAVTWEEKRHREDRWIPSPSLHDSLEFSPRAGASVVKRFDFELTLSDPDWTLDDFELASLGQGPIRLETSSSITDTYARVAASRPLDWLRRIDATKGKFGYSPARRDIVGFFSLLGCAVRFDWRDEQGIHVRTLEEGSIKDLHIDEWPVDLDLCGFLPEGEVKLGDKWTARGRPVMDALFGPSEMGFLGTPKDQVTETLVREVLLRRFRELGDKGIEVDCAFSGLDEESGEPRIDLRLKDQGDLDVKDTLDDFFQGLGSSTLFEFVSLRMTWKVDGRGHLIWNATHGRFESLDLEADIEVALDGKLGAMIFLPDPKDHPYLLRIPSSGAVKWTYRARAGP